MTTNKNLLLLLVFALGTMNAEPQTTLDASFTTHYEEKAKIEAGFISRHAIQVLNGMEGKAAWDNASKMVTTQTSDIYTQCEKDARFVGKSCMHFVQDELKKANRLDLYPHVSSAFRPKSVPTIQDAQNALVMMQLNIMENALKGAKNTEEQYTLWEKAQDELNQEKYSQYKTKNDTDIDKAITAIENADKMTREQRAELAVLKELKKIKAVKKPNVDDTKMKSRRNDLLSSIAEELKNDSAYKECLDNGGQLYGKNASKFKNAVKSAAEGQSNADLRVLANYMVAK